ncbi:MAG: bifunctional demethylmenaquinone methyltransferase/2-methoxy-6-polyprenyl-1,4-benzoquinol methylase UbiE, partial [Tunicatimonas sp.]|uniref:bifunctional demethylmenaquinone methyltransferase/2-methoxy-6-polyprenyl-1,4-benzoquinol methylase UbiE n=1 Tax=Tunicatimonas sp. TaxID=1940096 RepID=UPI003C76F0D6
MAVIPYKDQSSSKKEQVAQMFNNISKRYDLLNHLLSAGIDIYWRKKAIKLLKPYQPKHILDVATGTADFAIEALALNPDKVIGIDISDGMLDMGREKLKRRHLDNRIELRLGDSEGLHFDDNTFDAVIVAFGVRNFENLHTGLKDMCRVLKPNGRLVVLEFSKPTQFPMKQLYNFYFKNVLPLIGNIISKDQSAYTYLPESVQAFPDGQAFLQALQQAGYTETRCKALTFGISSVYT